MSSKMLQLRHYLDALQKVHGNLNIVETGSIRNTGSAYAIGDGHSTEHIARWIKESKRPHSFTSIDLDTHVAESYIQSLGLSNYVKFIMGNSHDVIPTLNENIHLALLDSANDADVILTEFQLVLPKMNKRGAIIAIDDVFPGSKTVVKGHKVIPYAQEQYFTRIFPSGLAIIVVWKK